MSKLFLFKIILFAFVSINAAPFKPKTNCDDASSETKKVCEAMILSMNKMAADQPPVPITQEPTNEPSTQGPSTQVPTVQETSAQEMDNPTTTTPCPENEDCDC
ncbi:hypothetical protein ACQ4LE_003588 [Meloidogyne hapla]|uniref:Secreted protein n=1 Tax=Meloidogyne hapla TaxID=6305 RepID=A0A1I8AYT6_MELHA